MSETGKITLPNGGKYEGEIIDGKPTGKGVVKFDNGETFEGTFINGVPNGKCKRSWDNGMYLESVYKDGKPVDGPEKCKIIYNDGSYYEGDCIDGKPNGWGKKVVLTELSEPEEHEGEWRGGVSHGYSVYNVNDTSAAQVGAQTGWTSEGIITQNVQRQWWIRTGSDMNNGKPTIIRATTNENFDIPQEDLPLGIKARLFLGFIDMCKENFPLAFWVNGNNSGFPAARMYGNFSVNEIDRQEEEWKIFSDKILPLPIEQKAEVYYQWLLGKVQVAQFEKEYAELAKKFSDISEYKNCVEIAAFICEQLETK